MYTGLTLTVDGVQYLQHDKYYQDDTGMIIFYYSNAASVILRDACAAAEIRERPIFLS